MLMTMPVAMLVIVAVIVPAAAVVVAMTVVMVGPMLVPLVVSMIVMRVGFVVVVMVAMVMVVVTALAMVVGCLFRLEGPVHWVGRAARAADQFGGPGRDVENIRTDLGGNVLPAELPGEAQQPGRAAGADLEQRLLRRAHPDEAPILELERIAVLQPQGPLQGEIEGQSARRGQLGMRLRPGGVVTPP